MVIHMMEHPPEGWVDKVAEYFVKKSQPLAKNQHFCSFLKKYWSNLVFEYVSPQILRPFTRCYHTCSTNDPSFTIGNCQVRFFVLIFDHSVTTYSALDVTHAVFLGHVWCTAVPKPCMANLGLV